MIKVFKVADIHYLIKQVITEKITYGRMVEIMNEMSNEAHSKSQKSAIPCVSKWIACLDQLPDDEKRVLCLHQDSESQFICWRTRDCNTDEPKWYGGAMPDYWQELPNAI